MNSWQDFISKQTLLPAQLNDTISALTDSGLLYVGGDDATEFLQNQLSNDIRQIDASKAQLSSFSTAKGRMTAIFRVIQIEGGYLLMMPHSILDEVQQQLQKYVIRSQVVMADISDSFAMIGLSAQADNITADEKLPADIHQVYQSDSLISVRIHSGEAQNRYLLLTNDEQEAIALWSQLSEKLSMSVADSFRLQEIAAGVPTIYQQTMQAFVLQMSNLQMLDGVSFKKGCYPGQEVVARMQYLGKLKRRMYLAQVSTSICPVAGDELKTRDAETSDGAGKVVDAVKLDDQSCLMLFIAQIEKAEAKALVLVEQPDVEISIKPLPYRENIQ
jgi:tRNA-modifying protein YgfZ